MADIEYSSIPVWNVPQPQTVNQILRSFGSNQGIGGGGDIPPAQQGWVPPTNRNPDYQTAQTMLTGGFDIISSNYPSAVAAVAAAKPGQRVLITPGVYLNSPGIGNGITVPADGVTIVLSAGAEIQVQTWGQPGIDCIGRNDVKILGPGVVRYVGVRGDHTGTVRGGAAYTACAGVYFNGSRIVVDGLRTINMPTGVYPSSWNGSSIVGSIGRRNTIRNLETEGMDFGILYTCQEDMILDNIYGHDDIDDSSGANPTHVIYGSATNTNRATGASFTNFLAKNILYGQPYQMKYHDSLTCNNLIARDSRGIANFQGCVDGLFSNLLATGCLASLTSPNGFLTVQDSTTARCVYDNVSLVAANAGVDQRSAIFAGSDITVSNLNISSKRTSSGSANTPVVLFIGDNFTIKQPKIVDTSGFNPVGIMLGDGSTAVNNAFLDDPRFSGVGRCVDTFGTSNGVIRYNSGLVSFSSAFTTTATAYSVYRDGVRITNATPEGAITAPPGTVISRTDNGQLWIKVTGTGNIGWAAV